MNLLPLIESKRDGHSLSEDQLRYIVSNCDAPSIPDYQLAAFLMAVFFQGLNNEETRALTLAMRDSGDVLRFPPDSRPVVDKHSTGGVGDKVSLVLTPLLASLGFRVPMISGRGLGITGGTLDKLDSIPGFKTALPTEEILKIVQTIGCVICGQTERMVPADKKLYALRDVTGTVPSIPLIVASILSKKLAENPSALVLDVKFGAAAFMVTLDKARELARAMVALGNECGVNTRALLTDMDAPLGRAAGNWLEVKEAVACLEGKGPDDLRTLVVECAAHLLLQTGRAKELDEARTLASSRLDSGEAMQKFDAMLGAQGADRSAFSRKLLNDHTSPIVTELKSSANGWLARCDARIVGEVVRSLGAGRFTRESRINYDVGVDALAKPGERIAAGSVLARVHAANEAEADTALRQLESAFEIADVVPASRPPLIREII